LPSRCQILEQCKRLVRDLQTSIEVKVVEGLEDLDDYFKANDSLQSTLQIYEGIKDGTVQLPLPRQAPATSEADSSTDAMEDFLSFGGMDSKASSTGSGESRPCSADPVASIEKS
jgi:hypothetical protein